MGKTYRVIGEVQVGPKQPRNPDAEISAKARLRQATWDATQWMSSAEIHEYVAGVLAEVDSDAPRSTISPRGRERTRMPSERCRDWIDALAEEGPAMDYAKEILGVIDALEVAADLLRGEGYDTDPDYRQEWQTVADALGASPTALDIERKTGFWHRSINDFATGPRE